MSKKAEETAVVNPISKPFSLLQLITDQARINDDVFNHIYDGSGTEEDPYVVTWVHRDAGNPMNWNKSLRWMIILITSATYFGTTFCASVYSGTIPQLVEQFDISVTLATAGMSLFVLGLALGPLFWGPLSETHGRQFVFCVSFMVFTVFLLGCTARSSIATLSALRFLAGLFGSSPIANAGGFIADVFPANERSLPLSILSLAPSLGAPIGPLVGGLLGEEEGWIWVMILMAIFGGALWLLGMVFVPETYAPVLLRRRAKILSTITGKVYKSKLDIEKAETSVVSTVKTALCRPWQLLLNEPIVLSLSVYMAMVYGTLFLLFGAYPTAFRVERGWSQGLGGLALLGIGVGMIAAVMIGPLINRWQIFIAQQNEGSAMLEARLIGCMIGGVAIPFSMFWFALTSQRSIHWIFPVMAGIPFGFGQMLIFSGITNYLIDAYTCFAASALAANAVMRFLFGATFPLFTDSMYRKLGTQWASAVPGFLALVMAPTPFILYKYGAQIRRTSVYISKAENITADLKAKQAVK